MPLTTVRGVAINYEILGDHGPWVAISPGGRRGLEGVQSLAGRLAAAGYRVLIHDRRNCGASDVAIEGNESEYEIWADDLYLLLSQLKALPACIGATEEQLRSIKAAACIVPGNDMSHPRKVGENLSRILPACELHRLKIKDYDLELTPREEWDEKESELAAIFTGFLKRVKSAVVA